MLLRIAVLRFAPLSVHSAIASSAKIEHRPGVSSLLRLDNQNPFRGGVCTSAPEQARLQMFDQLPQSLCWINIISRKHFCELSHLNSAYCLKSSHPE